MKLNVLIAGGGTGGHVYPALATIEALQSRMDCNCLYIGARGGIEARIVPEYGIPLQTIWIAGFQRFFTLKNLLFPFKLIVALMQSFWIVLKFKPRLAIGTGGYVSGPILLMASFMGVPVLIQEQDVYPGITTRLLAKYADRICLAYDGARNFLKKYEEKLVVTGNPIRQIIGKVGRESALKFWNFNEEHPVLLVFGGSQGAQSINDALRIILPELLNRTELQILWQTGERDFQRIEQSTSFPEKRVRVVPYIREMEVAYAAADLVISRAGAITLAELAQVAKPTILIPYPFAAGDHQLHNAQWIAQQGAALVVTEGEGFADRLKKTVFEILNNSDRQKQMKDAWKRIARPDAAEKIVSEALELISEEKGQEIQMDKMKMNATSEMAG